MIAEYRIDVSEIGDDDSVFPFNYEEGGRHVFPFFGSENSAKHFASTADDPLALSIFQPYALLAGFMTAPENEAFELVFEPRSSLERRISSEERSLLRQMSARP
jgi:hypothetical protein